MHSATSLSHTLKHKSSRQRNLASHHDEVGAGMLASFQAPRVHTGYQ